MRIVLAPVGTRGDVQPMLALAQGLVRRGHRIVLCVAEPFRALAAATGAVVVEGGGDPQAMVRVEGDNIQNPLTFLRLAREEVAKQFTFLDAACDTFAEDGGVDVIAGTLLCAAAPTIAQARGAKYVGISYFPHVLPTRELPPPLLTQAWFPRALYGVGWSAYLSASWLALKQIMNGARAQRGLPLLRGLLDPAHVRAGPLLCAFDEAIAQCPRDWDIEHYVTGFWFADDEPGSADDADDAAGARLEPSLSRFLDEGPPPVFIGFGSMPSHDARRTMRAIRGALAQSGKRAVVAAGWAGLESGGDDDAGRLHLLRGNVDHRALFPRCAAVVHHGGAGTTAQAARSRRPQVVVPHMFDQLYWGERVHAAGLGPKPLSKHFTDGELAAAITAACADDATLQARVDEVGRALAASSGVANAVALMERHGETRPRDAAG